MQQAEAAPQVAEPFPLSTLRHSVSHLMASAVAKLYPGVQFGFGPGDRARVLLRLRSQGAAHDADLRKIEKEMERIAKRSPEDRVRRGLARRGAGAPRDAGQSYKVEAVDLIPEGEKITFYRHGDWEDLCEGPHVDRLDRGFHFKLLSVAGAYWRGDEKRPMLQRVYGHAFWKKEDLDAHLKWLEDVKERDHRKLGAELDLFSLHQEAGAGFVFWHPKLGEVRPRDRGSSGGKEHQSRGYQPVVHAAQSSARRSSRSPATCRTTRLDVSPMDIEDMPYRGEADELPGAHPHLQGPRAELPRAAAAARRARQRLPLRALGVVHGMLRVRGFTWTTRTSSVGRTSSPRRSRA
jgi:threonyl-tRNA synthetase